MSPQQVELALKKQRLQMRSEALRRELAGHAAGMAPLFTAGDRLREGVAWLRRHPEVLVATATAAVVARPRRVFRWIGRGAMAWQSWQRLRGWLDKPAKPAP